MKHLIYKYGITIIGFIIIAMIILFRSFAITYVSIEGNEAKITINFLVPMEQQDFDAHVYIDEALPYATSFACSTEWISDKAVCITIKEDNFISGQSIKLVIKDAPTRYKPLSKSIKIPIQFSQPPELLEAGYTPTIATTGAINIRFNTPIKKKTLLKFIETDIDFDIEAATVYTASGHTMKDPTNYVLTPKTPLTPDAEYTIYFKEGMPSQSGLFSNQPLRFTFYTDSKPSIVSMTPKDQSNWVGLYPAITLISDKPIVDATLTLNGESIEGEMVSDIKAVFYPKSLLEPNTTYNIEAQVTAKSGEKSNSIQSSFKTTDIADDVMWLEIVTSEKPVCNVYIGENKIQTFDCAVGHINTPTKPGTYYLLEKADSIYDETRKEGANIALKLSEGIEIIGLIRDPYWNIKPTSYDMLGHAATSGQVMLSEENITWLYQHFPLEGMVVIHP